MKVFLAVRVYDVAIIKAFIYEPLCDKFIEEWNAKEEIKGDKLHKETYKVDQE